MVRTSVIVLLLALGGATGVLAQARDAETRVAEKASALSDTVAVEPGGQTVFFPILGYTPDTSLLFGASVLRFFYLDPPGDATRPSTFSPVFVYTVKNQVLIFLGTELNWGEGRWRADVVPSYQKFPDEFYGVGRDVGTEPLEGYTPEQFAARLMIEREVLGELRFGLDYRAAKHQVFDTEPGGVMESGDLPGSQKAVTAAPGLHLAWDTRDNAWAPRRGLRAQANALFYRPGWGSDFRWTEYELDLRGYLPLGDRAGLAGQARLISGDGDVPFYRMARLGGEGGLRGYSSGRFMDKTMALARVEYRSGEILGRFGGVLFAGYGDVAPTTGRLTGAAQLYTVGFGIRATVNRAEQVKVRLDMGFGNDDQGFFLSLGEAF